MFDATSRCDAKPHVTPSLFVLLHNCRCASRIECYAIIVRFVTQSEDRLVAQTTCMHIEVVAVEQLEHF